MLNEPLIQQKALFLTAHQTIRRLKAFRSRVGYTKQLIYALKAMQTYKKNTLTRDVRITIYANGALNREAINSTWLVSASKRFTRLVQQLPFAFEYL